jgi:AbrB family looped-hinge helix DNA binding protein
MIFSGIVRRVDDLGRIVIPKEIRRAFGLHENDALEIYVDNENEQIILRKRASSLKGKVDSIYNEMSENFYNYPLDQVEKIKNAFKLIQDAIDGKEYF